MARGGGREDEATRGRVSTLEEFGLARSGIPTIRYIREAVAVGYGEGTPTSRARAAAAAQWDRRKYHARSHTHAIYYRYTIYNIIYLPIMFIFIIIFCYYYYYTCECVQERTYIIRMINCCAYNYYYIITIYIFEIRVLQTFTL